MQAKKVKKKRKKENGSCGTNNKAKQNRNRKLILILHQYIKNYINCIVENRYKQLAKL